MEQAALGQLLARKELMVLATGGGIVSEPLTFDLILQSFYTIWLKAAPEEHMARVRGQGDLRPMADDRSAMAELRTILLSREPLYARASGGRHLRSQRGCGRRAPGRCGGAGAAERSENVRAGVNYSRVPGAAQRFFAMRRSAISTLRSSRYFAIIRAIHPP